MVSQLFSNTGTQGAVFHVYNPLHLDRIAYRYTVEAGKQLDDQIDTRLEDSGHYDLLVLGASGFVRTFKGTTDPLSSASPEVNVTYDRAGGLHMILTNSGNAPVVLTVSFNAYRKEERAVTVAPGAQVDLNGNMRDAGNWHDLTVANTDLGFERRLAGRCVGIRFF